MPPKIRYLFIIVSLLLGLSFFYLSYLVSLDIFRTLDYETMVYLQQKVSNSIDVPFSIFTLLGSSEISLITLGVLFSSVLIFKRHLYLGSLLYFFIYIIELWGKLFIYHPEPPEFFSRYALGFHFPSSFIVRTDFSFPSGHMARSTFLSLIGLFILAGVIKGRNKKIISSLLLFLFVIGMFISRVYLGEHWISDVMGGFLLGASLASLSISFW